MKIYRGSVLRVSNEHAYGYLEQVKIGSEVYEMFLLVIALAHEPTRRHNSPKAKISLIKIIEVLCVICAPLGFILISSFEFAGISPGLRAANTWRRPVLTERLQSGTI